MPFATLVRNLIPWFVTRQVFTGAGKVGSENGADAVDYQISQRADFFEEEVGLETTLKRPIVNTRDEPHADPQKYRRLHVIVGDANLCEVATFLKVGTTAIVLAMIEDGFIDKDLSIARPVPAMRAVSHDPTCRATVDVASLGRCTAIELQWEFLRLARKYADETGLEACGGDEIGGQSCSTGGSTTLHRARARSVRARRPARLGHEVRTCCARTSTATTCEWNDPKLELLDLQYHDVRPGRSLYERLVRAGKVERLVDEADVDDRDGRPARRPPGRISAARASPAGPTRWSPRTGTAWCSTSAPTRCEGSR